MKGGTEAKHFIRRLRGPTLINRSRNCSFVFVEGLKASEPHLFLRLATTNIKHSQTSVIPISHNSKKRVKIHSFVTCPLRSKT